MYLIESVESKDKEVYNRWHKVVTGKRCIVDYLKHGEGAHMMVEGLLGDHGEWNGFRTSWVLSTAEKSDYLFIETRNSVYTLRRLPDDSV